MVIVRRRDTPESARSGLKEEVTPRCRWCAGLMEVYEGEPYYPECVSYGIVLTVDAIEQTLARTLARRLVELGGPDAVIEQAYAEALEEEEEAPEE